jgi:hypothetical protein
MSSKAIMRFKNEIAVGSRERIGCAKVAARWWAVVTDGSDGNGVKMDLNAVGVIAFVFIGTNIFETVAPIKMTSGGREQQMYRANW